MNLQNEERTARLYRYTIQTIVVCVALAIWEVAINASGNTLIPPPSAAFRALADLSAKGILFEDLSESLRRVLVGFALASVSGVAIGLLLGASSRAYVAMSPLIELLRPIPPIAWIPLSMTVFGLGDGSACFVIFIGAFYPVLTNTILGVREVPEQLIDAAKSLGCSQAQCFQKVIWPASLPSIFAGLKVGLGFAWMCVVAAEMIAAHSGLGYEIQLNRQLLRLDRVVAGMAMIGVVGFAMNFALAKLENFLLPWKRRAARLNSDQSASGTAQPLNLNSEQNLRGASVQFTDLRFAHNPKERPILDNINLEVPAGEILCLLGPSGCGKTTLLRLLAGLLYPSNGQIMVGDQALENDRRQITMVFQDSALFPWRTAEGNVRFALESKRLSDNQMRDRALEYLRLVGLEKKAQNYPGQLSGGQQQRVALARALAYEPRVLLMDEPFASLDSQTKENLQDELSSLLAARGITGVFVTHDIREAIFLGDRVAVLSKHGGKILSLHKISKSQPRAAAFRYTSEFSESRLLLWNVLKEASDEELSRV